jgi:ATP-dependent exoDNAse (exonuclease V) beta subunit
MKDPAYKYYGMTKEEIKASWDKNRIQASGSGTNIHNDIERYYNDVPVENDSIEYQYFLRFVQDFPELKPYRTEWKIYDEELKLAGSIDMVYKNKDGTLSIYDWKRVKEINKMNNYDEFAITPCISHFHNSNFWHYTLQLNTYRAILERKYGFKN